MLCTLVDVRVALLGCMLLVGQQLHGLVTSLLDARR